VQLRIAGVLPVARNGNLREGGLVAVFLFPFGLVARTELPCSAQENIGLGNAGGEKSTGGLRTIPPTPPPS